MRLTVPKKEDEVFGLAYPGLEIEGGLDGCSRLLVPEGWILLLHWDKAVPISSSSPAPASLRHLLPWGTHIFGGFSLPGHSCAGTSSNMA